MEKNLNNRLEEVKKLFEQALAKAEKAVRIAQEELNRPLTHDEQYERENGL